MLNIHSFTFSNLPCQGKSGSRAYSRNIEHEVGIQPGWEYNPSQGTMYTRDINKYGYIIQIEKADLFKQIETEIE